MHAVKPLYLKAILLTVGAALWLIFTGCGATPADALVVTLEIPVGESPENFWYSVSRQELTIEGEREPRTLAWIAGGTAEVSAEAGEKITFSGYNETGAEIVRGKARVGKEKRVTIRVRELHNY